MEPAERLARRQREIERLSALIERAERTLRRRNNGPKGRAVVACIIEQHGTEQEDE